MAKQSVTKVAPAAANQLFQMNGTYAISPETRDVDLHGDIQCWLEAIHGTIDTLIDGLQDEGGQIAANPAMVSRTLFGTLYLLEMVQGAVSAMGRREAI